VRRLATIRGRLLTGLLLTMLVALGASALVTSKLLEHYLHGRDSDTLRKSAARLQHVLASGPQQVDGDQMAALLGAPLGIVVLGPADVVRTSTGSGDIAPRAVTAATRARPMHVVRYHPSDAINVLAVRVSAPGLRVTEPRRAPLAATAVVLTIDTEISGAAVHGLVVHQVLVVGATLLLVAVLALLVLRIGLRPLSAMASTADAIAAGALRRRLPTTGGGAETDQLAATVNRAFDAQAKAEDKVRAFAADASHELRTPLATISGWLDLYNQGGLRRPGQLEHALERVNAETGRMRLLVEELSLLARLDAGRPLAREPVDVVEMTAGIVEDARVVSPDRAIAFDARVTRAVVIGDEARLAQVLRNLVGNAVQHTPDDATVRVVVAHDGGEVVVAVEDDGPGIAPAHLPHVFERFWRAEGSRSRQGGGSGLGLSIVHAITTAHGGTVTARPGEGGGTTMTVRLPLAGEEG
jgi:two-component system OmpR family sensor kinase